MKNVKKWLAALIVALTVTFGAGVASPAQAVYGASVKNVSVNAYVKVRMDDGTIKALWSGAYVQHNVWGVLIPQGQCILIGYKKYCSGVGEASYYVILQAGQYTVKRVS